MLVSNSDAWKKVQSHTDEIKKLHLRDLMKDNTRCLSLSAQFEDFFLDYSRQRVSLQTMNLLFDLSHATDLKDKIKLMTSGQNINKTEQRAVMHMALRAGVNERLCVDGKNVVPEVHKVLIKIRSFAEKVRKGEWKGITGKPLKDVIVIGIGGSYLGTAFVSDALAGDKTACEAAKGRKLRFLANVDPYAAKLTLSELSPETTLAIVVSKTFTTAETMLNANTVKDWLIKSLGKSCVSRHMVAVSTASNLVTQFGISADNMFEFWNWVGGRFSVCSAVGILPLTLQYGFKSVESFLEGARSMDSHFCTADPRDNLPFILGLIGVWNSSFLGYSNRALLPYSEALEKLAGHIQQLDMESNGKRVTMDGQPVNFNTGPFNFGEPGTKGQHSFYQLLHMGRECPADFIGFIESPNPIDLGTGEVCNHDELMANFFAQPDALAVGKTLEELEKDNVPVELTEHKVCQGNRPSSILLIKKLTAYSLGQLLALFEHRSTVEGFVWGINSFDQMGVELGKKMAGGIRKQLAVSRKRKVPVDQDQFNTSTRVLLSKFLGLK